MKRVVVGLVLLGLAGCINTEATYGELHVKRSAFAANMGKIKATVTLPCEKPPCAKLTIEETQVDSTTALVEAIKAAPAVGGLQ